MSSTRRFVSDECARQSWSASSRRHHVVTHEAINDICALAFRRAENQGMPEQVALIDEGVSADPLEHVHHFPIR
jgi:hypothetical protein